MENLIKAREAVREALDACDHLVEPSIPGWGEAAPKLEAIHEWLRVATGLPPTVPWPWD